MHPWAAGADRELASAGSPRDPGCDIETPPANPRRCPKHTSIMAAAKPTPSCLAGLMLAAVLLAVLPAASGRSLRTVADPLAGAPAAGRRSLAQATPDAPPGSVAPKDATAAPQDAAPDAPKDAAAAPKKDAEKHWVSIDPYGEGRACMSMAAGMAGRLLGMQTVGHGWSENVRMHVAIGPQGEH